MGRKVKLTAFAVLLLTQMFYFCECYLRAGDQGVCWEVLTTYDWSDPSYSSIKLEKDERGSHYTTLACCKNYEYDAEFNRCLPICSTPCINGTCIDVDTCICDTPLILVGGSCIMPTCTNCEHGDCTAPNVCECHPGYIKSEGICKKFCDNPCISGECVGYNKCKCHDGFMLDPIDPLKCILCDNNHELKCTVTCRHGYCSPPTACSCVPRKKSSIFNF
ncbi:unnamed protein product [Spodoptera littoralis]|uniref:EGF-like domain-containing protein n=1 Tax=Spodoptera littoralis TaxID=7109 RepID=A0A9P0NBK6_SPOLI|nr:unnamed protein product [Spodoptera littoralis]CAH1646919.1 unnamed protein product [Spodoptera littoralis]